MKKLLKDLQNYFDSQSMLTEEEEGLLERINEVLMKTKKIREPLEGVDLGGDIAP